MRGGHASEEFFATGRADVAGMLAGLAGEGLAPPPGEALDFGCGLGRLSRALAAHFEMVTGVDVSDRMVAQARNANEGVHNLEFVTSSSERLEQFADSRFTFVLSLVVLQHVSSPRIAEGYLREFVRVCVPGGIIVTQVPSRIGWRIRLHPGRLLNAAVRNLPAVPKPVGRRLLPYSMRLIAVSEKRVRETLEEAGAEVLAAFPDGRTGTDAAPSLLYVARRR